jgi:hypothetical protein
MEFTGQLALKLECDRNCVIHGPDRLFFVLNLKGRIRHSYRSLEPSTLHRTIKYIYFHIHGNKAHAYYSQAHELKNSGLRHVVVLSLFIRYTAPEQNMQECRGVHRKVSRLVQNDQNKMEPKLWNTCKKHNQLLGYDKTIFRQFPVFYRVTKRKKINISQLLTLDFKNFPNMNMGSVYSGHFVPWNLWQYELHVPATSST